MMKVLKKIVIYGILALVIFITTGLLFVQSTYFKNYIKEAIEQVISENLNAQADIQALEGDFWSTIKLQNITLTQTPKTDTLLCVNEIFIHYNPWALLKNKIHIKEISIKKLHLYAVQYNDSVWNFQSLLKDSADEQANNKNDSFNMLVACDQLKLIDCALFTQSPIAIIPDSVVNLTLQAEAYYQKDGLNFRLHNFQFDAKNPDLSINHLAFSFEQNNHEIKIKNLHLSTPNSHIAIHSQYESLANSNSNIRISKLGKEDLELLLPAIRIKHSPQITTDFKAKQDKGYLNLKLKIPDEEIRILLEYTGLANALNKNEAKVPFNAKMQLMNVKAENWWQLESVNSLINGELVLTGKNLLNFKDGLEMVMKMDSIQYQNYKLSTLRTKSTLQGDSLKTALVLESNQGKIQLNADLKNIWEKVLYEAQVTYENIKLDPLLSTVNTDSFSGRINIKGEGLNPDSLDLQSNALIRTTTISGIKLDSIRLGIIIKNDTLYTQQAEIYLPGAFIDGIGGMNLSNSTISANASYQITSFSFAPNTMMDSLGVNIISGKTEISGPLNNISLRGNIRMEGFEGFSLKNEKLESDFTASIQPETYQTQTNIQARNIQTENFRIDSIRSEISYQNNHLEWVFSGYSDTLKALLNATFELGDTLFSNLNQIEFGGSNSFFYLEDTSRIKIGNYEEIKIENFTLKNISDSDFELNIFGHLGSNQTQDLNFSLKNLNLNSINNYQLFEDKVSGSINASGKLYGSVSRWDYKGDVKLNNGAYGEFRFPDLTSNLNLWDGLLKIEVDEYGEQERIHSRISLQANVGINDGTFKAEIPGTFEASLQIDTFELAETFSDLPLAFKAILNTDIKATGSFSNPSLSGQLSIDDATYINKKYGVEIDNGKLKVKFRDNILDLDTLLITRDKGYLVASGKMSFKESLLSGNIDNIRLNTKAKKFYISKHKNHTLLIDADTFFEKVNHKDRFNGSVTILQSRFYLPALYNDDDVIEDLEQPLLLTTFQKRKSTNADSAFSSPIILNDEAYSNPFIDSLQGQLQLLIPKNTWLKSKTMNIEISGDLMVVKSSPQFELFGNVDIKRGEYTLYGRKFKIEDGNLDFKGGENIEPEINLTAIHTYRSQNQEKKALRLIALGKMTNPELRFELDNVPIPEADGVSILIWGKSMNEITFSESGKDVGINQTQLATNYLSKQLGKTIGNTLQLDMIELNKTEDWRNSSFIVGKYLTPDLFVIYERGTSGKSGSADLVHESITLEYELNRNLFFRLLNGNPKDSGIDVVLKFGPK